MIRKEWACANKICYTTDIAWQNKYSTIFNRVILEILIFIFLYYKRNKYSNLYKEKIVLYADLFELFSSSWIF